MLELTRYCDTRDSMGGFYNDPDHRQARMFRDYLIAGLLNVDENTDVEFRDNRTNLLYRVSVYSGVDSNLEWLRH